MYAISKKLFLALVVMTIVLTTGAWQSTSMIPASQLGTDSLEAPLFPGLTWPDPVASQQNVRTNINGDSFSLPGKRYEAQERYLAHTPLPQNLVDYYSNQQLGLAGWVSYDAYNTVAGVHYVFSHESGAYLSVEFLNCQDDASKICVSVWMSDQENPGAVAATASATTAEQEAQATSSVSSSSFGKISPANGTTNLNPTSVKLSWNAYSPSPDKYSYCIQEGSACATNDPDWTSTYDTSVTVSLDNNKTYYWQVKAITCVTCTPKTVVYANGGTAWYFKTSTSSVVSILGNVGLPSAVLSYVVSGTTKTVTASSTGAYSFTVPYNWSGTLTPSKSGYLFVPTSASFTNLTASQTIQNFAAALAYTISGNAGRPGVTLSYTDIIAKSVVSDGNGNYSIVVPAGWSGTVTPSLTNYSFSPASQSYTNLAANQTGQNFTATYITYIISGNVGVGGVTLSYTDTTAKTVTSNGDGSYSLQVTNNWSGRVTPSQPCSTFNPAFIDFNNVTSNRTGQNYTPTLNPAAGCASVNVSVGAHTVGGYYAPPDIVTTGSYNQVNGGPVVVQSTNGKQTLTSQRVIYGGWSYSEMMGLPAEQLTKEYLFPYYNNVAMDSQLRVSNVGGVDTTITVSLAGNQIDQYTLAAGSATRKNYANKNSGPLRVTSSASNILTTIRVLYGGSYSELMGFPAGQLTKEYLFPYYNNVAMDSQLRVSNVGGADTTIKVYLGSAPDPIDSYPLAAGGTIRKNYLDLNSGPLRVTSSDSNILTTIRVLYAGSSYSELMGFPTGQLEQEYWYPVYDNATLDSQLRVSNVGTDTTTITIYAGTELIDSYSLNAGAATRKNYAKNTGPLHVISSSQPILTTIRLLYGYSYYEMTGLQNSQLSTKYFFPWYNNSAMNSQLRFAVP